MTRKNAQELGPLHQEQPHTARSGMNQDRVGAAELPEIMYQVMGRHALQRESGLLKGKKESGTGINRSALIAVYSLYDPRWPV